MLKRMFAVLVLMVLAVAGWVGFRSLATVVVDRDVKEPPQQVVEGFYAAYLDSVGDRSAGEFHNPLVERTYRELPQLSAAYVQEIDADLDEAEFIAADPFLCAQDVPGEVWVKDVKEDGGEAVAVVTTDFADHQFSVTLERLEGEWKITEVLCE